MNESLAVETTVRCIASGDIHVILRLLKKFASMSDEAFHRLVLSKTEFIVQTCRTGISCFGPLPELSHVGTGKQRAVFLRLVFKNRSTFSGDFLRAERDGHFNLIRSPFLPRTSVKPKLAVVKPRFGL